MLQRRVVDDRSEIRESGMIDRPCYEIRADNAEAATEVS